MEPNPLDLNHLAEGSPQVAGMIAAAGLVFKLIERIFFDKKEDSYEKLNRFLSEELEYCRQGRKKDQLALEQAKLKIAENSKDIEMLKGLIVSMGGVIPEKKHA